MKTDAAPCQLIWQDNNQCTHEGLSLFSFSFFLSHLLSPVLVLLYTEATQTYRAGHEETQKCILWREEGRHIDMTGFSKATALFGKDKEQSKIISSVQMKATKAAVKSHLANLPSVTLQAY